MNNLKEWKNETGHTMRKMGNMLGVSASHICRVMHEKKHLSALVKKRLLKIRHLEHLIRGNPADTILLKHELKQLIYEFK